MIGVPSEYPPASDSVTFDWSLQVTEKESWLEVGFAPTSIGVPPMNKVLDSVTDVRTVRRCYEPCASAEATEGPMKSRHWTSLLVLPGERSVRGLSSKGHSEPLPMWLAAIEYWRNTDTSSQKRIWDPHVFVQTHSCEACLLHGALDFRGSEGDLDRPIILITVG